MTVKYLIAAVGLFLLTLSACERTPKEPIASSPKVSEGETNSALKSEDPLAHQPLSEKEQAPVDQTNTVTPPSEPIAAQTKGSDAVSSGIPQSAPQSDSPPNIADTSTAAPDTVSADSSTASTALKNEMGTLKFTVKQLVSSGLLGEGGSNVYYSYVTHILNKADRALRNSGRGRAASDLFFLCNENISGCIENGLSLEQLNKPMIMRLIHVAGQAPSKFYKTAEDGETFFVLQGEQVTQDLIKNAMERIEQADANKILVNLPQIWNDISWFFYFSSQLKEKQIDLHIVGQCGSLCANYAIPAAHKVFMEPYGHIGYNGNFSGLLQDIETVYSTQVENSKKQFEQEHFSQNETEGLINLFDRYSGDLRTHMTFEQTNVGDILNQISRLLSENPAPSFWDLSREGKRFILSRIRREVLDTIKTFFFVLSKKTHAITNYYTFIQNAASVEADYYKTSRIIPKSNKNYSYLDFINLTSWLIKNISYPQLFSMPRPYYNVPEKDKSYVMIFPSADILRNLGINIEGENNVEVPRALYEDSENIFLFLSADDMENCDFFKKKASFTTETLQKCLSQDSSL